MGEPNRTLSAGEHAADMAEYLEAGRSHALSLGNRGPLTLTADGRLDTDFLDAYRETGFYVFEGVLRVSEVDDLRAGAQALLDRAPVEPDSPLDRFGRPARDPHTYTFMPALGDPWGGTDVAGGRHMVKMAEPEPPRDTPGQVVTYMSRMCDNEAMLRVYGHPLLLAVAEAVNGSDFVPFSDGIFVKQPGLGASIAWHQDGVTYWDTPDWDEGIHGFNFQVQLYRCTPANCLWVVPGSHREGKADLRDMMASAGGTDRFSDAVPLFCETGDVTIVNRQAVHGSFPNTSPDLRVSVTFGFHRRSAILGQSAALLGFPETVYDEARIERRAQIIALAIDARAQHFPDEARFCYKPLIGRGDAFSRQAARAALKDYDRYDLGI